MLVTGLLTAVSFLLSGIAFLIPSVEFPWQDTLNAFAGEIGDRAAALDTILPISEMAEAVGWIFVSYLPFVLTFTLVRFIYKHIPVIGAG